MTGRSAPIAVTRQTATGEPVIEMQFVDDGEGDSTAKGALPAGSFHWLAQRLISATGCPGRVSRGQEHELEVLAGRAHGPDDHRNTLAQLVKLLGLQGSKWVAHPARSDLPFVAIHPELGCCFAFARSKGGEWQIETPTGRARLSEWPQANSVLSVRASSSIHRGGSGAWAMFAEVHAGDRSWIPLAAIASTLSSILLLATSLYSMQIYDRVIGQGGVSTLIVLTAGVMVAIVVELVLKIARSAIMDEAIKRLDVETAIRVFDRMLSIRLDQFPGNLGTLAAQVRGFETIRAFVVARSVFLATDAPFAILFLVVIMMIAGPIVAAVPAIALIIAVAGGMALRHQIQRHSEEEQQIGHRRQGLLVETVQNLELIKATGSGWTHQSRWNELSRRGSEEGLKIKKLNDKAGYLTVFVQQASYVALVGTGAYIAVIETGHAGGLTSGSIIACSILSGRVLSPVAMIPGLMVQWANARASLENLERLYALDRDNEGQERPLVPLKVAGGYALDEVCFAWPEQTAPLKIQTLTIKPGERIAVIGAVGAGKSTLLKLLAGVAKPTRGVVLLDGLDIQQIAADRRAEAIGYLPQVTRMVSGTLRENLTLGLPHLSDEDVIAAARLTGLAEHISQRPQGLDLPITEAGAGLSRGQKQLVGLTRLILGQPDLWLLDEPTASMDEASEVQCLAALRETILPGQTLVLVTHKYRLLELVDRLVVLGPRGMMLDGPRDAVIAHMSGAQPAAEPVPSTPPAVPGGEA